jgi:peptide deformylase
MSKDIGLYNLVFGIQPIFRQKAEKIKKVDDELRLIADRMAKTMYHEGGIGMGANMVGILKSIVVIDLVPDGKNDLMVLFNPEITEYSKETQVFEERSLCFPGIKAEVTRPKSIKLNYLDYDGNYQEKEATGFLATVMQHEIDYLNGKIYLDYLSKFKADTLKKKLEKHLKINPPHVHGAGCRH